ncbi:MAG: transcriptional regulatory protein RprY [Saprospiraceae bacterium]|nr:MAG: transcriptional regulatory protein RprY [Saprospiraceae bacterium]
MKKSILLVEDNDTLGYILKEYLEMKGFQLVWAKNGQQGLAVFNKTRFDLCVLDIMMPEMDGFTLAEELRRKEPQLPFIFLTARSLKVDKLKGFHLGADDYIVKPVDEEELVARIKAVLRRSNQPLSETQLYKIGQYTFDFTNQKLSLNDSHRQLTEREGRLLQLLCQHKDNLLSRQQVLKSIWNNSDYFTRRSMDVFISRLRKYLADDPNIQITNVYGSGFILSDGTEEGG